MTKDDLLNFWLESGKTTKSRVFFYNHFKDWLDQQPDTPPEAKNDTEGGTITRQQEKSYHLWLDNVAKELDKEGYTLQDVMKEIKHAEIRPTGKNIKEVVWRAYMEAAVAKKSGRELNKHEVDRLYEGLNKWFGERFHIHVPFPADEHKTEVASMSKSTAKLPEYQEPEFDGTDMNVFEK